MKKLFSMLVFSLIFFYGTVSHAEITIDGPFDSKIGFYARLGMMIEYQNFTTSSATAGVLQPINIFQTTERGTYHNVNWVPSSKSWVGAVFRMGNVEAKTELGWPGDMAMVNGELFRHLYVQYKSETWGSILVGKTNSPSGNFIFVGDPFFGEAGGLNGYGTHGILRRLQVRYGIKGFAVALIDQTLDYNDSFKKPQVGIVGVYQNFAPRIEASYELNHKNVFLYVYGMYSYNNIKVAEANNETRAKTMNMFNFGFALMPKIDSFTIKLGGFYAQNTGLITKYLDNSFYPLYTNGKLYNAGTYAGNIGLMYTYDIISPEIGFGYQVSTLEAPNVKERHSYGIFASVPIRVMQYITLIPAVGYFSITQKASGNAPDVINTKDLRAGMVIVLHF